MNNIEGYKSGRSSVPSGSRISSYSRSYSRSNYGGSQRDSSYRRTTSPPSYIKKEKKKQGYTQTLTMGGTGGAPFWGWGFMPNYLLYPLVEYAPINSPTIIDLGNDEKKNKKIEKFNTGIEIKNIYPEYKI